MARTVRREKTEPAEREFPYTPGAVPVGATWEAIAETALATPGPVTGHTSEQRILDLLGWQERHELTVIANGH